MCMPLSRDQRWACLIQPIYGGRGHASALTAWQPTPRARGKDADPDTARACGPWALMWQYEGQGRCHCKAAMSPPQGTMSRLQLQLYCPKTHPAQGTCVCDRRQEAHMSPPIIFVEPAKGKLLDWQAPGAHPLTCSCFPANWPSPEVCWVNGSCSPHPSSGTGLLLEVNRESFGTCWLLCG